MLDQFEELHQGIVRIDTGYIEEGRASCYLLEHRGEVALIETGIYTTLERVNALLRLRGIEKEAVKYVIPTHVHLDHAGCAGRMMAEYPCAQLVIHPRGARHMIAPEKLIAGSKQVYGEQRFTELYGEILPVAQERVTVAEDGFSLNIMGRELFFRHSPGHANHHFVIWDAMSEGWFTGDTFGICYREMRTPGGQMIFPSTTPVQFDPDKLFASIDMMMACSPKYAYLTHYGRVTDLDYLAEQQKEKIERYCEIATTHVGSKNALKTVVESLTELELGCLHQINPALSEPQAIALLAMDMELNAQGLIHWAGSS